MLIKNKVTSEFCVKYEIIVTRNYILYVISMSRRRFRVNPYSIVCLNLEEPLVRNRRRIWRLRDSNEIRTHNHQVHKRTLNHLAKLASLAKCLSVRLRFNWSRIQISLLSLRNNSLEIWALKLRFLVIYENILKSIATAHSEYTATQENMASYNTDDIVPDLIDFFGDDWKEVKTQTGKRYIHNCKKCCTD